YGQALKWYNRAAGAGDARAINMLGYMLAQGIAVKQDAQKAANQFLRAAVRGDPTGQYNLAMLLQNGNKDSSRENAHALFNLAAVRGHAAAPAARQALERRMSQESILRAQSKARRWRDTWTVDELKHTSSGTGFVINFGGGVVTNHHVVDGCDRLGVRLADGIVPADLVFANADVDLALIQMRPPTGGKRDYGVGRLSGWDDYFVGEEVTIFGFPLTQYLDKDGVLTVGTLNALSGWRGQNDQRFLQISAPVQPGNSGSAVVDEKGAIIGVVWGGLNAKKIVNQNVNFAAKHTVLRELLNRYGITYYEAKSEGDTRLSRRERYAVAKNMTRQIICYAFDMNKLFKPQ
ncbi:MAG: trypsin-like peptidase domain-containing protein, partial [Hyphomicrobiales bacterium]|nr:trypsin-like peptidase domain-containing protein [Hyphomicrobiales bacterium]